MIKVKAVSHIPDENVAVPLYILESLIAKSERINALERLMKQTKYVSIDEVAVILGIEGFKENENKNETV